MPDGLLRSAEGFRAAYRETLSNIEEVVTPLDAPAWDLPSGCPGWSVHDLVAHVCALESILIGRELPAHHVPASLEHVKNPAAEFMEIGVDYRRAWPVERLLAEFREVTTMRLRDLESLQDTDLERETRGFFGPAKTRNQLTTRVFDIWSHEQDVRRAVGAPGGFDGPAAGHSRELLVRGVGNRAADRLSPPDSATLLVDVSGPGAAQRLIRFAGGKGRVVDEEPSDPTVTLRLDLNTLTVLGCGRADDPGARSRVAVTGDVELGRNILEDIAITP